MEPLVEVELEEWLAPALTFAAREDWTNEKEWVLMGKEEDVPPLTATTHFPSRFATANVCLRTRASSISVCKCLLFDAICSVLLAYNAWYLSLYSLGIEEEQMSISPNLIFNTWRIARDWCPGKNVLPHHLHKQPFFPFWLLVLSLMKWQWKILAKGSSIRLYPLLLHCPSTNPQN